MEWHSIFKDMSGDDWKLDLILIRKGSKFDGVVEHATEGLNNHYLRLY